MTARHQLRLGRRLGRDRAPIDAAALPPVGETLQAARERKGVDLYRAERDTKIRLRYLAALEDSDWNDLPAPVYTKGFLRNYAIYLGLEPDEIVDRWRDEMEQMRTATKVAVAPPPMPLAEPGGRRLTISPSMIVAALVGFVVLAFVGYIGVQFLRFVDVTEIGLIYPANVYSTIDAEQVTLQGTAGRGAVISITGPDGQLYSTTADEDGHWSRDVPLSRGENNFTVLATDTVTQRDSKPLQLTIIVPLPTPSPGQTMGSTPLPPQPISMSLFAPTNGVMTSDPNVTVSGTTTGTRITISSTYLGPPPALPDASPTPLASAPPKPNASATPSPSPSTTPVGPARDITVSGSFSETLEYPVGHWRISVTAYATGLDPVGQDVEVTIQETAPVPLDLLISVEANSTKLTVTADGQIVSGLNRKEVRKGEKYQLNAASEFCLRTPNAAGIHVTLDGTPLGLLGAKKESGSWIIRRGEPPQPSQTSC